MAKAKLSVDDVDRIVSILTSWQGKLTWDLLVIKVTAVVGRPFTRQALDGHAGIKRAFGLAKERAREGKSTVFKSVDISPELATALQRVDNLRSEVILLKHERNSFLETFATWLYNARNRGLTERDLNQPLPPVERHRSAKK